MNQHLSPLYFGPWPTSSGARKQDEAYIRAGTAFYAGARRDTLTEMPIGWGEVPSTPENHPARELSARNQN